MMAGVLILACMDARVTDLLADDLDERYPHAYKIRLAGASKAVVRRTSRPTVLQDIGLAITKGVEHIVIADHMDCAAFQGSKNEERAHRLSMHQAATIIQQQYPQVDVELYLIGKRHQTVRHIESIPSIAHA